MREDELRGALRAAAPPVDGVEDRLVAARVGGRRRRRRRQLGVAVIGVVVAVVGVGAGGAMLADGDDGLGVRTGIDVAPRSDGGVSPAPDPAGPTGTTGVPPASGAVDPFVLELWWSSVAGVANQCSNDEPTDVSRVELVGKTDEVAAAAAAQRAALDVALIARPPGGLRSMALPAPGTARVELGPPVPVTGSEVIAHDSLFQCASDAVDARRVVIELWRAPDDVWQHRLRFPNEEPLSPAQREAGETRGSGQVAPALGRPDVPETPPSTGCCGVEGVEP